MMKVTTYEKPSGDIIYRLVWSRENGEIVLAEMEYEDDLPIYTLMGDLDAFEELLLEHDFNLDNVELYTRRVFTATRIKTMVDVFATVVDQDEEEEHEFLVASNIPLGWGEHVVKIVQFIGTSYRMFDSLLSPEEA